MDATGTLQASFREQAHLHSHDEQDYAEPPNVHLARVWNAGVRARQQLRCAVRQRSTHCGHDLSFLLALGEPKVGQLSHEQTPRFHTARG